MKSFLTFLTQAVHLVGSFFNNRSHYPKRIKAMYAHLDSRFSTVRLKAMEAGFAANGANPQAPKGPIEEFKVEVDNNAQLIKDQMELDKASLENELEGVRNKIKVPEKQKMAELDLEHGQKHKDEMADIAGQKAETVEDEEMIVTLDDDVAHFGAGLENALNRLDRKKPKKGIWDSRWPMVAVTIFLVGIEENIISYLFEALRFANHVGALLALALAAVVGFSAHLAGAGHGSLNKADVKNGIVLGASTILLIAVARIAGTNELALRGGTAANHFQDFFFMGINIVFWLTGYFIESKRYKRLAYFEAKEGLEKAISQRAKLQRKVLAAQESNGNKEKNAKENYKSGLKARAMKGSAILAEKENRLVAEIKNLSLEKDHFSQGVENYKMEAEKGYMASFSEGVKKRRPKILELRKVSAILMVLSVAMGTGCQSLEEKLEGKPSHVVVRVLKDVSAEPSELDKVNAQKLADFISNDIAGLGAEKAPRTKVEVQFQEVGELAIPGEETIASLEEGESKFSRVELDRVDSILAFRQLLQKGLGARLEQGSGQPTSEINHCVCRALNRMSESSATTKTVLIFSDLLQNDDKVSFYKSGIEDLTEEAYQSIAAAFHKACPLKDLSGIEVIVFQTPTVTSQKLVLAAQPIWKRYLESHGAKVSFRPNL